MRSPLFRLILLFSHAIHFLYLSLCLLSHLLLSLLIFPFYTLFIVKFALYKYPLAPIIFTFTALSLLTTIQLAPILTIVLNDTGTSSLLALEYPTLFIRFLCSIFRHYYTYICCCRCCCNNSCKVYLIILWHV